MTRIVWLRRAAGTALAVAAGTLLVWAGYRWSARAARSSARHQSAGSADLELTGLSQTFLDGPGREVRVHVDRLTHQGRRIGPLTINPLKEIEMHGVRLVLDDTSSPASALWKRENADRFLEESILSVTRRAFEKFLTAHDLGFISRVLVVGFDIDVLQSGVRAASLHAGRLRLDPTAGGVTLEDGVALLSPSGDRLEARETRWDSAARRLVVTGAYLLRHGGKARSGTGGSVSFGPGGEIVLH